MDDKRVFMHTCCAPCSIYCLDHLEDQGYEVTSYFYNPNIHPYKEFERRLETLRAYSRMRGFALLVDDVYDLDLYLRGVVGRENNRCRHCYEMRLDQAAAKAAAEGFPRFTTTLLVSPYQNHELVRQVATAAAERHGVDFLYVDFRPGFRRGQQAARELGLYRQPYCGCIYSERDRFYRPGVRDGK